MNDKHDFGEYMGNNEGDLMEEFLEDNCYDPELLHECLEWMCEKKHLFDRADDALECFINNSVAWGKKFDAFCEKAWDSFRTSGPEPDRDGD